MSDTNTATQSAGTTAASTTDAASTDVPLLQQAIAATLQTDPDRVTELLRTLTREALAGTVVYNKNLNLTINNAIKAIDAKMSEQLNAVMHHPDFKKLEGTWSGLQYLVKNSETGTSLKIKVFNASKKDLLKNLTKASEFDQSDVFKKIYESEFGSPGGEPYGCLLGDYEITNHPDDIELLTQMSSVAAAAFAPFITAASPQLFGFDKYDDLSKPRDLEKIFDTAEYTRWRSFRESDDSRFVTLVLPRTLARLPYGRLTAPIDAFGYEEAPLKDGVAQPMAAENYTWMNSAFVYGARLTEAFAENGWCTAIRGAEGGGMVRGLPSHVFRSDDGDMDQECPTEVGITDRREAELSKLGFLPLCHYKGTDYAVFFGSQTTQKPAKYDRPEATANAAISARLPYVMATSRFAHYLKIMGRDKVGSFMEASDAENWLNRWIVNYVNGNADAGQDMKAKYPLAEAKVEVHEIAGSPGSYNAVAWLRPWLQMEELTTSLRMVARIPARS